MKRLEKKGLGKRFGEKACSPSSSVDITRLERGARFTKMGMAA
jgi:hypothetical protein